MSAAALSWPGEGGAVANGRGFARAIVAVVGPGEATHYGLIAGVVVLVVACLLRRRPLKK